MFFLPIGDAGASGAQTLIPMYEGRAPSHLEMVVAIPEVPTVLASLFVQPKQDARIEADSASKLPVVVAVDPVEDLVAKLYAYLSLPEDWDGYGGVAPSAKAVLDAEDFVRGLPSEMALPRPMIAGDGEIGLYWKSEGGYAEATFVGSGEFKLFVQRGRETIFADNLPIRKSESIADFFALAA